MPRLVVGIYYPVFTALLSQCNYRMYLGSKPLLPTLFSSTPRKANSDWSPVNLSAEIQQSRKALFRILFHPTLFPAMKPLNLVRGAGLFLLGALVVCGLVAVLTPPNRTLSHWNALIRTDFPRLKFVKPAELDTWLRDPNRPMPQLLDVREPAEFAVSHLPQAIQINPHARAKEVFALIDTNQVSVLYCAVGYRSASLADELTRQGYTNVFALEGSIFQWANEGRALERDGFATKQVHPFSGSYAHLLRPEIRYPLARFESLTNNIPPLERFKLSLGVFLLALFLAWESIAPGFDWFRHNFRSRVFHGWRNYMLGVTNNLLVALLFAQVWIRVAARTWQHDFGLLNWTQPPEWMRYTLAILVLDLWAYAWHRLNHRFPFFWMFHRVHHSELQMDVTSAGRFHAGEIVLSSALRIPVIALLGATMTELLVYETAMFSVVQFHHANIALPAWIEKLLSLAIVTPSPHRLHHSRLAVEANTNFSSLFSFWDRIFSTWKWPTNPGNIQFGLAGFEAPEHHTLVGMMELPLEALDHAARSQSTGPAGDKPGAHTP